MNEFLPFKDLAGYMSWLSSLVVLGFLPGLALGGIWLDTQDRTTRLAASFGIGLLWFPLAGHAMSLLHLPLRPAYYLLVSLLGAWLLARSARYRQFWQELGVSIPPLDGLTQCSAIAATLVLAGIIQQAFAGYAASPHLNDASNHSFMVMRIAQLGSMNKHLVFGPPWGPADRDYLMGWHAGAALIAQLSGLKANVSAWYFAAFCGAMLPVMLTLIWRAFRLRQAVIALGVWFAVANFYTPDGIFSWGGYGQIIGLSLLPWVLIMLRRFLLRPDMITGVATGLALVALLHIHTAEVFLVLILLIPALPARVDMASRSDLIRGTGYLVGTFALAGLAPLIPSFIQYYHLTTENVLAAPPGWEYTLGEFANFSGGNVPILQKLVWPALLAGFLLRATRRVALFALLFALLFCGLRQVQDPVSLTLGLPFYQAAGRAIYPQIYLLQPLMAALFIAGLAGLRLIWRRWSIPGFPLPAAVLLVLLGFYVIRPGIYWNYRNLENLKHVVPFSLEDARLAARMAEALPPGAKVANQDNDGSFWAMYISGMEFLDPCTWAVGAGEGRCYRGDISHLLDHPWPPRTLALRDLGTRYLFVSDTALPDSRHPLTCAKVDADPRFKAVLRDKDSAVYEILWPQPE